MARSGVGGGSGLNSLGNHQHNPGQAKVFSPVSSLKNQSLVYIICNVPCEVSRC